jgi:putative transposase
MAQRARKRAEFISSTGVQSLPVLSTPGVRSEETGELLDVEMAGSESLAAWDGILRGLEARGLALPQLCVIVGGKVLSGAVAPVRPKDEVQRCRVHKLRNILRRAPPRLRDEVRTDYHAFVYARSAKAVRDGNPAFLTKWKKRCPGVAASLLEASAELLTYTRFPRPQWMCIRRTNVIERLNEGIRRRVRTQSTLPNEREDSLRRKSTVRGIPLVGSASQSLRR